MTKILIKCDEICSNILTSGTSLVVQWLRLCTSKAGGLSLIPGQGTDEGVSLVAIVLKSLPANAGNASDVGSVTGSGRSPGVGNGSLPRYSRLGNPMDRGVWQESMGPQRTEQN